MEEHPRWRARPTWVRRLRPCRPCSNFELRTEGLCYIETSNLDGETNLKIKQASPLTSNLTALHLANSPRGSLRCDARWTLRSGSQAAGLAHPERKRLCCQWSWRWSAQLGGRRKCSVAELEGAWDQEASNTEDEVGKSSTLAFNRIQHTCMVFSDPFTREE